MAGEAELDAFMDKYEAALIGKTITGVVRYPAKREIAIHLSSGQQFTQSMDDVIRSMLEAPRT